jgi:Rrf2 family transcriptional regulator, nitric oxide-sensitive transcriptional repressor
MRLTNFTDYTLRVLIYLGVNQEGGRLATIGEIATAYRISENHLMKIVHHLAKEGYVETTRGNGGGMRLALAPDQINIGEVVRKSEEELAIVQCFEKGNVNCPIIPACTLVGVFERAMRAFFDVLDSHTLADLIVHREELANLLRLE